MPRGGDEFDDFEDLDMDEIDALMAGDLDDDDDAPEEFSLSKAKEQALRQKSSEAASRQK